MRAMRALRLIGLVLAMAVMLALMWNERRLATSMAALRAAHDALATVGGEVGVVRVSGRIAPTQPAVDPLFRVEAPAVRLDRTAETLQWRERREGTGDNRVLRYDRVWSADPIDSDRFVRRVGHANPSPLAVTSQAFRVAEATLAGSPLGEAAIDALPASAQLAADELGMREANGRRFAPASGQLVSGDPARPQVGDVRVRYNYVPHGAYTIVGGLRGGEFVPWQAPSGGEVLLAASGDVAAEELIGNAAGDRWRDAWRWRGLGTAALGVIGLITIPAWRHLVGERRSAPSLAAVAALAGSGLAAAACSLGWLLARITG